MQLSVCSYRGHRIAAIMRCVLPCPRTSIVCGNSVHATGEKAKHNRARNNAKSSKCFQFLCNNSDRNMVFQCINICQVPWEVLKTRPLASVFNTYHGTWQMLMHEKPCLIPILSIAVSVLVELWLLTVVLCVIL